MSGPYNVTFTAEMTTSSFSVSIIDDETFEDDETFTLKINSAPSIIDIGDPHQATVTIVDNEGKWCIHWSKYNHSYYLFHT